MNFDFSEKEFIFFIGVQEAVQSLNSETAMETGDVEKARECVLKAAKNLAATPYLRLGIETVPDMNGLVTLMSASEVLAALSPSLMLSIEMSGRVFGRIVAQLGDDNHKKTCLAQLLKGEIIGAVALSEEAMNVENEPFQTMGVEAGGDVVVNGTKNYVINAPIADWFAVAGRMGDEAAIFLVPRGAAGLSIGEPIATMGYRGARMASLKLTDCRIPKNRVIGPFKNGKEIIAQLRMWENLVHIGAGLGLMKASFDAARDYAKAHRSGGRPVIAYQEVGFKLSEMLTLYQTSQLLACRTAWLADQKDKETETMTHCAKVFIGESAEKVASDALQILAGSGFVRGNVAERAYVCAKFGQIAGTSTEIARVKIGDDALGAKS